MSQRLPRADIPTGCSFSRCRQPDWLTNWMPPPFTAKKPSLSLDRAGTDGSYCNGEIVPGSSKKTLYMGSPFAQPRHFAHTMQHRCINCAGEERRKGESREPDKPSASGVLKQCSCYDFLEGLRRAVISGIAIPVRSGRRSYKCKSSQARVQLNAVR